MERKVFILIASLFNTAAFGQVADFSSASSTPCRAFMAMGQTPMVGRMLDPIQQYVQNRQTTDAYMSQCVLEGYIKQECKKHIDRNLAYVVNIILKKEKSKSLPQSRRCGA